MLGENTKVSLLPKHWIADAEDKLRPRLLVDHLKLLEK